jgi:hypothetical protein
MLVFLYSPERPDKNNNKDFYREVKQAALLLSKKHKKVSKNTYQRNDFLNYDWIPFAMPSLPFYLIAERKLC